MKNEPTPGLPEIFNKLEEALRGAVQIVEEVERGAAVTSGLNQQESLRHLYLARNLAEDFRHRLELAIKHATRESREG